MNEEDLIENLQNKCRICLSSLNLTKESITVSQVIQKFQITYGHAFSELFSCRILDNEPQKLCKRCSEELLHAFELRNRVLATQKLLETAIECTKFVPPLIKIEPLPEICKEEPEKRVLICDFCSKKFQREDFFVKHVKKQHLERNNECQYCQKCYNSNERLINHIKTCTKHPEKKENQRPTHICPICGIRTTLSHISNHTRSEPLTCDICGATASKKSNLAVHMKVQHLQVKSRCKHCPLEFRNPFDLHKHVRVIHPEVTNKFKCRTCGHQSKSLYEQRSHRLTHNKPRRCKICGLEAKNMKEHVATHAETRSFACEFCGVLFKTAKTLAVHRKSHRLADYQCTLCGNTFVNNHLLRRHVGTKHPEYELPPPGTIMSKRGLKKLEERQIKITKMRQELGLS